MLGQTAPARLQIVLDALADLPIRLLLASGPVPSHALHVPANAAVYSYIPHMAVLPKATLAINHAGHGSVLAALASSVRLVCMPGVGADQSLVAQRVEALGAGKDISNETTAAELRAAVEEVLATRSYREASEHLATLIRAEDGATAGASVLETVSAH
jgi:UDP:flavonoid glycosyltransferase YjiC (YdhE family)